jgi:mannose-6-phosphate isomerase-like protein (cupin superfamily)
MTDESRSQPIPNMSGLALDLEGIEAAGEPGREASVFRYRRPDQLKTNRGIAPLVRSDVMFSAVQVIRAGGENSLHSHSAMDGFWFVLRGRARFYGVGDKLIGEIGQHEGVFVPRNVPYWFESVGDELLELLQVEAIDKTVKNTLTRHAPKKVHSMQVFKPEGGLLGVAGKPRQDAS